MYNRYIRNDRGQYDRIPLEDPPPPPPAPGGSDNPDGGGLGGLLNRVLGRLKLDGMDQGDILLLLLLLFLFADGEDDELLIALGLLLLL